jgi:hypothetical protein
MNARVLSGITLAAIVLTLQSFSPCGAEEKGGIDVQLTIFGHASSVAPGGPYFGTDSYDPTQPDPRTMQLRAKNNSDRTITLPAGYGPGGCLYGFSAEEQAYSVPGRTLMLRFRGEKPIGTIRIEPGKEGTVFWVRLDELLKGQNKNAKVKGASQWAWDWQLHPRPPISPIYLPGNEKEPRLASAAVFWAEVTIDKQVLRTPPVLLRIKQPDNASQPSKAVPPSQ